MEEVTADGLKRSKADMGRFNYEKVGSDGKKITLTVPGTPIPPVIVDRKDSVKQ